MPRESFIAHLAAEDDWTMVLKVHAVLEAALNLTLQEEQGGRFKGFTSQNVPLGIHTGSGKTALALGLGILNEDSAQKMDALTDLRNIYAHNPRCASQTIAEIVTLSKHPKLLERHLALPTTVKYLDNNWRQRVAFASVRILNTLVSARLHQLETAATDTTFNDEQLTEAIRQEWDAAMRAEGGPQRGVGTMGDLMASKGGTRKTPKPEKGQ